MMKSSLALLSAILVLSIFAYGSHHQGHSYAYGSFQPFHYHNYYPSYHGHSYTNVQVGSAFPAYYPAYSRPSYTNVNVNVGGFARPYPVYAQPSYNSNVNVKLGGAGLVDSSIYGPRRLQVNIIDP